MQLRTRQIHRLLGPLVLALVALAGCDVGDGNPPLARASASPSAIVENDGFQTAVTLNGSASSDPIDDPSGSSPLTFRWTIRGDEYRYEDGTGTSAAPVVRFRGDRPATIELTVTDVDGMWSTVVFQTQLSIAR